MPESDRKAANRDISLVDDRFWLEQGKKLVETSIPILRAQAERLVGSTAWLWSIYSATVVAAAVLDQLSGMSLVVVFLLAAPVPLLCAAHVLALLAQGPVFVKIDPRAPDEVERAHTETFDALQWRLRAAIAVLITASTFVGTGVVLAAFGGG